MFYLKVISDYREITFITAILSIMTSTVALAEMDDAITEDCKHFQTYVKQISKNKKEEEELKASPHILRHFAWENDNFTAIDNTDTYYTNGMRLHWINNPCRNKNTLYKLSTKWLMSLFIADSDLENYRINAGGSIGMYMFTPEDIVETDRQQDDRPFAGYFYLGQTGYFQNENEFGLGYESLHTLDYQFGVIGPASGQRWAQNYIHEDVFGGKDSFEAWNNQIGNKLALNANYVYQKYLTNSSKWASVKYHTGLNLGTISNYANAGADLVLWSNTPRFPSQILAPTTAMANNFAQSQEHASFEESKFYVFIGFDARYYASNVYIEGEGESEHDGIEMKPLVYDVYAGFDLNLGIFKKSLNRCTLEYRLFRRSKEFDSTNPERSEHNTVGNIGFKWSI